jgi:rod shape-determining protein MreD
VQTFKIAVTIAVALFLQVLLSNQFAFFKYVDLSLVVTVYFSLQRTPVLGMLTGLTAGLGGDAISGGILGVGGFTKTLIGYIISMASIRLSLENRLIQLAVAAVASLVNTLLFVGLYQVLEQGQSLEQVLPYTGSWEELGKATGWKALADTVAAIFVFAALDRVFREQTAARRMAIKRRFYE